MKLDLTVQDQEAWMATSEEVQRWARLNDEEREYPCTHEEENTILGFVAFMVVMTGLVVYYWDALCLLAVTLRGVVL